MKASCLSHGQAMTRDAFPNSDNWLCKSVIDRILGIGIFELETFCGKKNLATVSIPMLFLLFFFEQVLCLLCLKA